MKTALRRHKMLLCSLVLGIAAFILSLSVVSSYVRTEEVLVAAKILEPHHRIAKGDVVLKQVPARAIPKDSYDSLEPALGAYTRSRLLSGEIVLPGHLVKGVGEVGWSYDLPLGTRAMFLPTSASKALGGAVKSGERVDLIVAPRQSGSSFTGLVAAATPVKGLLVLDTLKDSASGEFLGVMVLADPIQCEQIARHLEDGGIYLALVPKANETQWPDVSGDMGVWPTR